MTIRILLLTQWFDPEPTIKGLAFASELVRQGFEVEVVTGLPNYPGGKIYPGYKLKLLQRETIDGVQITRVPLYASHDQSGIRRILNYTSFAASSLVYALFVARRADVIYAYHPPLTTGITAGLLRIIRRIPVVYDIQDMWPDTLRATSMIKNEKILKLVGVVCRWVYRRADHIAVLSPGFKRILVQRGVPQEKVDVIYNWADERSLASTPCEREGGGAGRDHFRILYAGNMGKAQALEAILSAAALLQSRGSRIQFVMLGGGVETRQLERRAVELALNNVTFIPPVSMSEVGGMLRAADALLVHLRKDPLFEITIPSKTQAYMAVGKPLLMAVNGDASDLVARSGGGVIADSDNPESIANAAESLAALPSVELGKMGQSAERYYQEHLSLAVGGQHFAALFRRLATSKN